MRARLLLLLLLLLAAHLDPCGGSGGTSLAVAAGC
jgi:hypothetical protein